MSQIFNVVRCCECAMYQVDINKTSTNKWSCKLCGTKQSLKQTFFNGESKECRERVKLLNGLKGKHEEQKDEMRLNACQQHQQQETYSHSQRQSVQQFQFDASQRSATVATSKWSKFLTQEEMEIYYCKNNNTDNNYNDGDGGEYTFASTEHNY